MPDFVIKVGIAKKIGMPNYGSFGAECAFDIHLDLGVLADDERFSNTIREAYKKCIKSVEEQIQAVSGGPKPESQPVPHVPAQQVVQPPVAQPSQAPQPSAFGLWMRSKSDAYGLAIPILTSTLYRQVCPQGVETDFVSQGKAMAAVWAASSSPEPQFEQHLEDAFASA